MQGCLACHSSLHCEHFLLTGLSVLTGRGKNVVSWLSSPPRREFRKPSQKSTQFPLVCVPGFSQVPAFNLCVAEPSAHLVAQCFCVLCSGVQAGLQNSKS